MAVDSPGQLIRSLSELDFSAVLGTAEDTWVEFKEAPYPLDTAHGRWELAKDVAALANKNGGLLVLGYKTAPKVQAAIDEVVAHTPVPEDRIVGDRYQQLISSWIYPQVSGIQFHWFAEPDAASGVFVIEVPPQEEEDKWFIVRRMIDESGHETGAIGIPIREGSRVIWMPAERIHHLMNASVPQRQRADSVEHAAQRAEEAITHFLDLKDWRDSAVFFLQAIPSEPQPISDFYERDGLWSLVANPPSLRESGFNIRPWSEPERINGSLVFAQRDELVMRLDSDGVFTVGVTADREFLGWAVNEVTEDRPYVLINSLALVEMTLEFYRFVDAHLLPRSAAPNWKTIVRCLGFERESVALRPGQTAGGLNWLRGEHHTASTDNWKKEFLLQGDPSADAFLALTHVYELFGLGPSGIPYSGEGGILVDEVAAQ